MEEYSKSIKRIEYKHYLELEGKRHVRTEIMTPNLHTIRWELIDDDYSPVTHYYSNDKGWTKEGRFGIDNPIPNIEQDFKESVGKNLIYFY